MRDRTSSGHLRGCSMADTTTKSTNSGIYPSRYSIITDITGLARRGDTFQFSRAKPIWKTIDLATLFDEFGNTSFIMTSQTVYILCTSKESIILRDRASIDEIGPNSCYF